MAQLTPPANSVLVAETGPEDGKAVVLDGPVADANSDPGHDDTEEGVSPSPPSNAATINNPDADSESPLAYVHEIRAVRRHCDPEVRSMVVATVMNYQVVINPRQFGATLANTAKRLIGVKGVLCVPDGVVPPHMESHETCAFLSKSHMGRRIRTITLRGERSEGLFLELGHCAAQWMKESPHTPAELEALPVGSDVTQWMGLRKYRSPDDADAMAGRTRADDDKKHAATTARLVAFPWFVRKTDQPHLQRVWGLFAPERHVVATVKIDGQSATFYYDPIRKQAHMCSRNFVMSPESNCYPQFVSIEAKHQLLRKLEELGRPIAIQGEIFGPGINGNRLQRDDFAFAVFGVYEWNPLEPQKPGWHWLFDQVVQLCQQLDLPVVPVWTPSPVPSGKERDFAYWQKEATRVTWDVGRLSLTPNLLGEGLVLATRDTNGPYVSAKILSHKYSLLHNLN